MLLCLPGKNFVLNHKRACDTEEIRSTFFPCTGLSCVHLASAPPPEPQPRPSETPKKKPVHREKGGSLVFSLQRNKLLGQTYVQEAWTCLSLLVKV